MNYLHLIIEVGLPYVISILEIMGIFVIAWSGICAFLQYFQNAFMHKQFDLQTTFSKGLVTGLEFVMAGEIFKTILIQSLEEIYILGGIILIRIALTLLIHFENRSHSSDKKAKKTDKKEFDKASPTTNTPDKTE